MESSTKLTVYPPEERLDNDVYESSQRGYIETGVDNHIELVVWSMHMFLGDCYMTTTPWDEPIMKDRIYTWYTHADHSLLLPANWYLV